MPHFMHHYWRAWDDGVFPVKSSPEERRGYGRRCRGYRLCDELIGRAMAAIDDDTVLVVASAWASSPYQRRYREGKVIDAGARHRAAAGGGGPRRHLGGGATMVPQWNLRVADPARRAAIKALFENAWRGAGQWRWRWREAAFVVQETEAILTLTPAPADAGRRPLALPFSRRAGRPRRRLPDHRADGGGRADGQTGHAHPDGLLAFFGRSVAAGQRLPTAATWTWRRPCWR